MHKHPSTRQPLHLWAMLMGIALLGWLIARTGTGAVIQNVRAVGWGMLLIIILGGISHLVRTWAWRLTFRSEIRGISVARTFALRLISEAIGTFGLAGQVVGDTIRVSLLGPTVPIADRISSVALDRGMYTMTAAVLSVTGILGAVIVLPLPGAWRLYALLFAFVVASLVVLTVISFVRGWRFVSSGTHAVQRLPWMRKWVANKVAVIEAAEENLLSFHSQTPKAFWAAIFLYFGSQVLTISEVYLLLRFMGVKITPVASLVVEAFTKFISVVGAVNPGNIGTYEGGNLLLAHLLGFTAAAGLSLALCRRARTLFWAGIGAVCLITCCRGNEQSKPKSGEVAESASTPKSQAAGKIHARAVGRADAPAVIMVVEPREDSGAFIPALARVGGLPVLLRGVLSVQSLQPSRIIVSVPGSANHLAHELRKTGRLPQSVEWRDSDSGTDLSFVLREMATTADRVVLLSGTTIYKPALLQTLRQWNASDDAITLKTDTEATGIYVSSSATALRLANDAKICTFANLSRWIETNCDAVIAPVPREEWHSIATPEDPVIADHKLDSWLTKPTDGVFARMNRKISIPISRQMIKLPVTPNMVTFVILGVSVAAGVCFSRGGYWPMLLGALLSVWASILDGCDGEVARLKLQSSELGCWLDTICDYLYYLIIFAGITWGLNRNSGTKAYLFWGAVLVIGAVLTFVVVASLRRRVAADHPDKFLARWQNATETRSSNPLLFLARNTEFIIRRCFFPYALLAAALLNITKAVFIVTAVGANLVWIIALYSLFTLSRKEGVSERIATQVAPDAGINAP